MEYKIDRNRLIEIMLFEFERMWPAKYLGFMILLLILFISVPAMILSGSISEQFLMSYTGGFRAMILYLFITITLTNSFCRDIKQGVMMDELTNPVGKTVIFLSKMLTSFLVLIPVNLLSITFASWLVFGSMPVFPILLVTLVQTIVSMLFAALAIFIGIVVQSIVASILTPLIIYFLEGYLLLLSGSSYSVEGIILCLLSAGFEETVMIFAAIIHFGLPLALLVFSFLFFIEVLELD